MNEKTKAVRITARQFKLLQELNSFEAITDTNRHFRCMRCQAPTAISRGVLKRYLRADCYVCLDCGSYLPATKGKS